MTLFALPVFKAPIPAGMVQSPPMPLPAKFGGIIDYPSPARVAAPELHGRRCHDGSSPAYGRARISESSRLGLHATTFQFRQTKRAHHQRSEEHTSELQSLMRNPYAVFCLKKKKQQTYRTN